MELRFNWMITKPVQCLPERLTSLLCSALTATCVLFNDLKAQSSKVFVPHNYQPGEESWYLIFSTLQETLTHSRRKIHRKWYPLRGDGNVRVRGHGFGQHSTASSKTLNMWLRTRNPYENKLERSWDRRTAIQDSQNILAHCIWFSVLCEVWKSHVCVLELTGGQVRTALIGRHIHVRLWVYIYFLKAVVLSSILPTS